VSADGQMSALWMCSFLVAFDGLIGECLASRYKYVP
jgi:hypothetical protein